MPIYTERPGGGDDQFPVFRARSADEARTVRVALEKAGVPVELPDQAIDAWFAATPGSVLPVKVALKDSARAIKAISEAIPREEPSSPILEAHDRNKAAEEVLAVANLPLPKAADPTVLPATAV